MTTEKISEGINAEEMTKENHLAIMLNEEKNKKVIELLKEQIEEQKKEFEEYKELRKNICEPILKNLNILGKLQIIQKLIQSASKDGTNQHFKYKFVSINSLLEQVKPLFDDAGIMLNMRTVSSNVSIVEKKGFVMENTYECIFIDTFSGETYVAEKNFKCLGIDSAELGLGKSISYAKKYFLINFFNIPIFDEKDEADLKGEPESEKKSSSPAFGKPAFGKPAEKTIVVKPDLVNKEKPVINNIKPEQTVARPFAVQGNPDAPITKNQMSLWFQKSAGCGIMVGNKMIPEYLETVRGFEIGIGEDISHLTNAEMQGDMMIFNKGEKFVKELMVFIRKLKNSGIPLADYPKFFDGKQWIEEVTPVILQHADDYFVKNVVPF